MKEISQEEMDEPFNSYLPMQSTQFVDQEQMKIDENSLFIGSLACWGITALGSQTKDNQLLYFQTTTNETLFLKNRQGSSIELPIVFAPFLAYIYSRKDLAKIEFFAEQQKPEKLSSNQRKNKRHFKKLIRVRLDLYIREGIFNEIKMDYSKSISRITTLRDKMFKTKKDSPQWRNIRDQIYRQENGIFYEKIIRSLILYLMEKSQIKVINRSFVKPPPRMNHMMRAYRKKTIGLITQHKGNDLSLRRKIHRWKNIYKTMTTFHFCSKKDGKQYRSYYENMVEKNQFQVWGAQTIYVEKYKVELLKLSLKNVPENQALKKSSILEENRKKLMQEIGASNFDSEGQSDDEDQNQSSQQHILMKKNQALMQKFEKQNKHFREHPNPAMLISILKSYQKQALQWMKFREGKLSVSQLFQENYISEIEKYDYERKLSPFWQEVVLIGNQKFYINYLTGQFTNTFYEWKSIKGGILADQMGLGKTVMTLSLLADEEFYGLNLIVVPVSVILQWKDEIKKHCGPQIKVFQFHSNSKARRKVNLKEYDIILITYATIGNEFKAYTQNKIQDTKYLFDYQFRRVILDEAHNIKGTKTLQFNGVMNLKSEYSWCLTGTLIQNSQQDLFAIFKFLRVEVFSQEYWWNQYIKNSGCSQAKLNVIQTVLRPIVLRRTKNSTSHKGQAIITLKSKQENIIKPQFTQAEQRIYKKLEAGVKAFFKRNTDSTKNYTHVFQIISKLRQFCCHPVLIFGRQASEIQENDIEATLNKFLETKVTGKNFREKAVNTMLQSGTNCIICIQQPTQQTAVMTQCGHFFCEPCLKMSLSKQRICPLCRAALGPNSYIKKNQVVPDQVPLQIRNAQESSKLKAIFQVINQIVARKQKCVIFTQWIQIIGLIQERFIRRDIQFGTIKGDIPVKRRQLVINRFRQSQSCQFLIVSIRAGGTGLNLAFANNVMICDPWWNPSHEDQAIGRVHRMGQQKNVNVYRFIMKNSIQQKIQKMHASKRKLADQVMMQKGSLGNKKGNAADELIRLLQ